MANNETERCFEGIDGARIEGSIVDGAGMGYINGGSTVGKGTKRP